MRMAALDIGSSSCHLLVASVGDDGLLRRRASIKSALRLGAMTLPGGQLSSTALSRATRTMRELRAAAEDHGAQALLAVATSAVRQAPNHGELVRAARTRAGVDVRVIDGSEEARLAFIGSGASIGPHARGLRLLVIDVGGGSTELAIGRVGGECTFAESLCLGTLGVGPVHGRRWRRAERRGARQHCRDALAPVMARARRHRFDLVAFCSGSARVLARLADAPVLSLAGDRSLDLDDVAELGRRLARLSVEERGVVPGLPPRRGETIVGGAMILRAALELAGVPGAVVTRGGLREGIILDHARGLSPRSALSFRIAA